VHTRIITALATLALAFGGVTNLAQAQDGAQGFRHQAIAGAVYTATNASGDNAVLVFDRLGDGRLVPLASVPTGGAGTGTGLGNQGGLVLSKNERWLLVVNAGSNTVSVFSVRRRGLRLTDVEPSGGLRPVSVTEHRGIVYVLNAGSDTISGFRLGRDGRLRRLDGSTRSLSGAGTAPAQVGFAPDGDVLMVTEKATQKIVTFEVDRHGYAGQAQVQDSNGVTPFGFSFGKRDQVFVSEAFGGAAGASAASSYELDDVGLLTTLTASAANTQSAACWLEVTPNGRFAYVTNAGSGSVSGYRIGFDGELELLDADGRTGITGGAPIDLAITDSGRLLYGLVGGTNTIAVFRVRSDGSLTPLPFTAGIPAGANGLAVR